MEIDKSRYLSFSLANRLLILTKEEQVDKEMTYWINPFPILDVIHILNMMGVFIGVDIAEDKSFVLTVKKYSETDGDDIVSILSGGENIYEAYSIGIEEALDFLENTNIKDNQNK